MSYLKRLCPDQRAAELDDDPVLELLKSCVPLSLADKRRAHQLLGQLIASQAARTPVDAA